MHRKVSTIATKWPGWEVVIGIESHVQIKSRYKLFSGAQNPPPNQEPNTFVDRFDIACPGTLPRLNRTCVALGIRAAIALSSSCQRISSFDRKHYFYADLPAGYQITQHYKPFAKGGKLNIKDNFDVRIKQIQLEQDTAKTSDIHGKVEIDYNRAGCALLEIVTEPDMRSPEEAALYVKTLQRLLRAAAVSDGNMEDGSLRCDINVSVNRPGKTFGTRCEIKNLNSIRSIAQAITFEASRHIELLENNASISQETRGFNADSAATFSLRSKEDAPDYRYMPDPNLPPLIIAEEDIESAQRQMPEVPEAIMQRLAQQGLTMRDIDVLLTADSSKGVGFDGTELQGAIWYFDQVSKGRDARVVSNWMTNELLGQLSFRQLNFSNNPMSTTQFGELIDMVQAGSLTATSAKTILRHIMDTASQSPISTLAGQLDLVHTGFALDQLCDLAIEALPSEAAAVRKGNKGPMNRLVGHVMRSSKGAAKADAVKELLMRRLIAPTS